MKKFRGHSIGESSFWNEFYGNLAPSVTFCTIHSSYLIWLLLSVLLIYVIYVRLGKPLRRWSKQICYCYSCVSRLQPKSRRQGTACRQCSKRDKLTENPNGCAFLSVVRYP